MTTSLAVPGLTFAAILKVSANPAVIREVTTPIELVIPVIGNKAAPGGKDSIFTVLPGMGTPRVSITTTVIVSLPTP